MGNCAISDRYSGKNRGATYLIVCFRYIGDVLMTTPLAASIKKAQPDAVIDYLVFEGTGGVLAKNPHVRHVFSVPGGKKNIGILASLFRKYDVAIGAYPSDRTAIAAGVCGKRSVGLTYGLAKEWWKNLLLSQRMLCDDHFHVVRNILSLLTPLNIPPISQVVMGYDSEDVDFACTIIPSSPFVVFHPYSRKGCKFWPADQWGKLAALVQNHSNCKVLFTRTPAASDGRYLDKILEAAPPDVEVLKQSCTLGQLAAVIKKSRGFVGIDTVVTHIAASLEIPTFALFGPSFTRYWGPWPQGADDKSPYAVNKGKQQCGCVTVIQKDWDCVPCNKESCRISTENRMECLHAISAEMVFEEIARDVISRRVEG